MQSKFNQFGFDVGAEAGKVGLSSVGAEYVRVFNVPQGNWRILAGSSLALSPSESASDNWTQVETEYMVTSKKPAGCRSDTENRRFPPCFNRLFKPILYQIISNIR